LPWHTRKVATTKKCERASERASEEASMPGLYSANNVKSATILTVLAVWRGDEI
jgi:hypothetical protein